MRLEDGPRRIRSGATVCGHGVCKFAAAYLAAMFGRAKARIWARARGVRTSSARPKVVSRETSGANASVESAPWLVAWLQLHSGHVPFVVVRGRLGAHHIRLGHFEQICHAFEARCVPVSGLAGLND